MILIVASSQDPAGINIATQLIEHFPFERSGPSTYGHAHRDVALHITDERAINADRIERSFPQTEALFFITRHASEKGVPTLSTHAPGNFGTAELGGRDQVLCPANPHAQSIGLRTMHEHVNRDELPYDVSFEATHHGPYTEVPTTFFEIGSATPQWTDEKAGYVVADATMAATSYADARGPTAIGVGGGHYPYKITDVALATEWSVGHIIPRYAFPLSEAMAVQMVEKNGPTSGAIFDWKGTPQRASYRDLLEQMGIKVFKTKDF
jgi:D-aminoacyl-tRNA deacylase